MREAAGRHRWRYGWVRTRRQVGCSAVDLRTLDAECSWAAAFALWLSADALSLAEPRRAATRAPMQDAAEWRRWRFGYAQSHCRGVPTRWHVRSCAGQATRARCTMLLEGGGMGLRCQAEHARQAHNLRAGAVRHLASPPSAASARRNHKKVTKFDRARSQKGLANAASRRSSCPARGHGLLKARRREWRE